LKKIGILLYSLGVSVFYLAKTRKKLFYSVVAVILALVIALAIMPFANKHKKVEKTVSSSSVASVVSVEPVSSETVSSSEIPVSSTPASSTPVVSSTPASSTPVSSTPAFRYKYNSNLSINDNVFLDALEYCGYNLSKHKSDGLMWVYILCEDKPHRGWLSNITYGGGSSGYETLSDGRPNIAQFEKSGLVCASYATYVYFNYLPNVAGIDTSALARPNKSTSANDWYIAGKKWVDAGYSTVIPFTARENGNRTVFSTETDIPLGSLMLFTDFKNRSQYCTHICLYAGYSNGYHWVTHVGNKNGPEFCAVERMSCGPDPQWPLAVITTPTNLGLFDVSEN